MHAHLQRDLFGRRRLNCGRTPGRECRGRSHRIGGLIISPPMCLASIIIQRCLCRSRGQYQPGRRRHVVRLVDGEAIYC
jgi:hypothetical protein